MLYGIRRDMQKQLIREGYQVRVYVPFVIDWYPYFVRRLAERPANLKFPSGLGQDTEDPFHLGVGVVEVRR